MLISPEANKITIALIKLCAATAISTLLYGCQATHRSQQASSNAPTTTNKTALRIHASLPRYAELSQTKWPTIKVSKLPLAVGNSNKSIPLIRQRLIALGDITNYRIGNDSTLFDKKMASAVSHFQMRHGLKPDGNIGRKTLRSLNVPPSRRYQQLQLSMKKWAKFPENVGSRYIRVNTASFELDLVKDGKKVMNMKIITGKPARPTPDIYSKIETIVLNPKWNVPTKIAFKDIIPKIIKDPNYLGDENIEIYSSWSKGAYKIDPEDIDWLKARREGFPFRFTQNPGNKNALGRVKFIFLNKNDVYLHDTPQKGLFAKIQRAFSSGCVRLEEPIKLVEYFIQESPSLKQKEISEHLQGMKTKYLRVKNPMPIYITYITAWVDKKGVSHFREDIYKRNRYKQRKEISSK